MDCRIVPLPPSLLDRVVELERACFPADPWSRRLFEESLENENTTALAALAGDGTALGYLIFTAVLDEGSLDNLAVSPAARRRGVASALLGAMARSARERGARRVYLEVRPSNRAAAALYEKWGWRAVGRRKNYYLRPREDAVIMELELENGTEDTGPQGTGTGL